MVRFVLGNGTHGPGTLVQWYASSYTPSIPLLPYCGWKKFPSCRDEMPQHFNKGHIHHHVIESMQFLNAEEVSDESDDDI